MKKTHAQSWPKTLPKGWELNHLLRQAEEVGGDFCNARYREPYLYLLIGDVAGKGPTASLLAQQFHTAFDSATLVSSRAREVLHFMHELISEGLERADTFVTLAVVVMDTRDGSFTYASAGHTSTYWLHYEGPQAEFLEATGFPFGIPAPDQSYREIEGRLEPGDSIWLYTDGVTEVPDRYNHIFGRAGLLDVLLAVREASLDRQVAAVRRAVGLHHGTQSLPDDMAILAIRRTPEHPVLDALPFVIWARYMQVRSATQRIAQQIRLWAERFGWTPSQDFFFQWELAVSEVLTNIVQHAYVVQHAHPHLAPGRIQGCLLAYPDEVVLDVWDAGVPFKGELATRLLHHEEIPPEEGYGLYLVQQSVDHIAYRRVMERNWWQLRKRWQGEEGKHES